MNKKILPLIFILISVLGTGAAYAETYTFSDVYGPGGEPTGQPGPQVTPGGVDTTWNITETATPTTQTVDSSDDTAEVDYNINVTRIDTETSPVINGLLITIASYQSNDPIPIPITQDNVGAVIPHVIMYDALGWIHINQSFYNVMFGTPQITNRIYSDPDSDVLLTAYRIVWPWTLTFTEGNIPVVGTHFSWDGYADATSLGYNIVGWGNDGNRDTEIPEPTRTGVQSVDIISELFGYISITSTSGTFFAGTQIRGYDGLDPGSNVFVDRVSLTSNGEEVASGMANAEVIKIIPEDQGDIAVDATVDMQETGVPLTAVLIGLLMFVGGIVLSKR